MLTEIAEEGMGPADGGADRGPLGCQSDPGTGSSETDEQILFFEEAPVNAGMSELQNQRHTTSPLPKYGNDILHPDMRYLSLYKSRRAARMRELTLV